MNNENPSPNRRGRRRGFDPDEALDRAMRLFWDRGYEATSISDLTEAMGIAPPSLYGAFGDKKQLFLKAVERYAAVHASFVERALTGKTARGSIRRLLLDAIDTYCGPRQPKGCMIVLSATNCAPESADVRAALASRRRSLERIIKDRIEAGRNAGELPSDADVGTMARLVAATLYGLSLMARDGTSRASMRKVVEQCMRSWPGAQA